MDAGLLKVLGVDDVRTHLLDFIDWRGQLLWSQTSRTLLALLPIRTPITMFLCDAKTPQSWESTEESRRTLVMRRGLQHACDFVTNKLLVQAFGAEKASGRYELVVYGIQRALHC